MLPRWFSSPSLLLVSTLSAVACGTAPEPSETPAPAQPEAPVQQLHPERRGIGLLPLPSGPRQQTVTVDPRRSLAVTDQVILQNFSFQSVMNQLVAQAGVSGLTSLQLYRQWWDTANPGPGLGLGAHCDDELLPDGTTGLNGFSYSCPREEGTQISEDPFSTKPSNAGAYIPIGVFNRFDLASQDGSDCGEYRILFARREGQTEEFRRGTLIFEAVLPNPQPELGLAGCRPVAQFWADLSLESSATVRGQKLRDFYFTGLPGFMPVVHLDNYGNRTSGVLTGQVRTNQFIQPPKAARPLFPWTMREFKLRKDCSTGTCALRFVPVTAKTNPGGVLFSPTSTHPQAADFQSVSFPAQVAALANADINRFSMQVEDRFNSGQSVSQGSEDNYSARFTTAPSTLRSNLQAQLTALGSTLTPDHIVRRALTQSCAGCHEHSKPNPDGTPGNDDLGNGMVWPRSLTFVHVSEQSPESGPDGQRFRISPALTDVFLPHRKQVLESFLSMP
ncbi:hypothetical protein [Myxococcus sp. RHSTA-1-4]|uniref:hypothetical protein n=1 Tax=Myxococcus sp. RHSTA-1-4 TaxID=2874601 RepID=UPI001CC0C26F|nr:hypothetical protein [Myxococcus sp. RHSTA-1-4]MBZ4422455.1 hypothetical protein [Myxococcus sp. RHSTA-1-4]